METRNPDSRCETRKRVPRIFIKPRPVIDQAEVVTRPQANEPESTGDAHAPKRRRRQARIDDTVEHVVSSTTGDTMLKPETSSSPLFVEQDVEERVKIFVGSNNAELDASKADLEKSSVLYALIREDEYIGPFIMHPMLRHVSVEDFLTLMRFIQGSDHEQLKGLATVEQDPQELIHSGKLYLLAKKYKVIGMPEEIFENVKRACLVPYSLRSIIDLACLMFKSDEEVEWSMATAGREARLVEGRNGHLQDPFEDWIVERLAVNHKEIMRSDIELELFWKLERITTHRRLIADVYYRCAEQYCSQGEFRGGINMS